MTREKVKEIIDQLSAKYPYILKWGLIMNDYDYDIAHELVRAKRGNAPSNAIYCNYNKLWRTTDDITNQQIRKELGL